MRRLLLSALVVLLLAQGPAGAAAKRGKKSKGKKKKNKHDARAINDKAVRTKAYSLNMKIEEGAEAAARADIEAILAMAKASDDFSTEPLLVMLRSASLKLQSTLRDREKKAARDAERKRKQQEKWGAEAGTASAEAAAAAGPVFTKDQRKSRELKGSMSSSGRCTMPTYTKASLAEAFASGTVNLELPFMVRDATDNLAGLQEEWTSDNLRQKKYGNVQIQYLNAKMAKIAMSQNGQAQLADKDDENAQAMEVLQPEIVDFKEYFAKCFSSRKRPGPDTEHCEQDINALRLGRDFMGQYALSAFGPIGHRQDMDSRIFEALYKADEDGSLAKLVGAKDKTQIVLDEMEKMSSRRIVFGPSGSGSSMAQIGMPFAEALVHGRRRWFLMKAEAYMKLKEKAGNDFQPGAAFGFFEDMYAELEEEFGMKASAEAGLYECDQGPGDVIFAPSGLVRTSMSLSDAISYKQELLIDEAQVAQYVDARVWQPMRQQWGAAACFINPKKSIAKQTTKIGKALDTKLGGLQQIGIDGEYLASAIGQQLRGVDDVLGMLLPVSLTCHGAAISDQNRCASIKANCDVAMQKIAKMRKTKVSWLGGTAASESKTKEDL
jgi:hypothetical protein